MKKEKYKMIRVLYNPLANNKNGKAEAEKLKATYGSGISFEDITKISDKQLISKLPAMIP